MHELSRAGFRDSRSRLNVTIARHQDADIHERYRDATLSLVSSTLRVLRVRARCVLEIVRVFPLDTWMVRVLVLRGFAVPEQVRPASFRCLFLPNPVICSSGPERCQRGFPLDPHMVEVLSRERCGAGDFLGCPALDFF